MDSIYRRTSLGQEKLLTRSGDMLPRLKTLLMLIDGKTPRSKLINSLPNFGDVEALLEALELQGLITSMPNFMDTVPMMPGMQADLLDTAPVLAETALRSTSPVPSAPAMPQRSTSLPAKEDHFSAAPAPTRTVFTPPLAPATRPMQPAMPSPAEMQLAALSNNQRPQGSSSNDPAKMRQAMQVICDSLSEIGSLDAIDMMVRIERCQSAREVSAYVKVFHGLCAQALGAKVAEERMREVVRMLD